MSVQFGRWDFNSQTPTPEYVEKMRSMLAPYGPDGITTYAKNGVTILYGAFHTTPESWRETQPAASQSGSLIVWDGRLDNRTELIRQLQVPFNTDSADVDIVAAAYDKWGERCLPKLIGDWAVSIWNPADHSLIFAKDPIGTHHLYYIIEKGYVAWSTLLDPLVLYADRSFRISEEYIAGWFAFNAAAHLTPYVDVQTVPPASSVRVQRAKYGSTQVSSKYWDLDPGKRIRYRNDREYEEHFRTVFATAVQRRLRSDRPVLAELSGGLDSSSIVCMADLLIANRQANCPRLDTISWYNDSFDHLEPQSNELRWFTKVEEKRGRTGCHINFRGLSEKEKKSNTKKPYLSAFESDRFSAFPVPHFDPSDQLFQQYTSCMKSGGHRVTLSGIGGGEFTGGFVPSPTVELQNLLSRGRLIKCFRQLNAWAARMRQPRWPLLWEAVNGFLSAGPIDVDLRQTSWFDSGFVRRNQAALRGYVPTRVKFFGPLPSFQDNFCRVEVLRRLVAGPCLAPEFLREERYPYLDRDVLEFLFGIPREQVVGVGTRRFLMKRTFAGIIPDEVLNRRPKDFLPPESPKTASEEPARWPELDRNILSSFIGIVDAPRLSEALRQPREDKGGVSTDCLERTLVLESWLRHLAAHGVLTSSTPGKNLGPSRRSIKREDKESALARLGTQPQSAAKLKSSAGLPG